MLDNVMTDIQACDQQSTDVCADHGGGVAIVCYLRQGEIGVDRWRQRWLERGHLIRLACRRVWRNVARQSKPSSRVAAPIVMIPVFDVESILRTWTPDSPCDILLKGAQAASRQPSQPSQPTRPAFAGLSGEEPSLHACGPFA